MPTENWYPISSATHDLPAGHDAWTNSGGANKNASTRPGGGRAGPATHDDNTTLIQEGTINDSQALNLDWPGPVGSVSALDANFRHVTNGVSVNRQTAFVNAAGTLGSTWSTVCNASGSWTSTGPVDVTSGYRPGGGAWDVGDFADDKTIFGRVLHAADAGVVSVTSYWGSLTYAPPSGGFIFLLQLAGLGALPFVGAMDFSQFTRYLSWRRVFHPRHTILTGDEVQQAWRELRAYRHLQFFQMGVACG